ncbi:hypothetical protein HK097_002114 [Rhizophlyctis rosea]|uniref:Uncharacterized protein n=1 Tax=Rhizophlyctis rosea TaxID=64517 RepID=A0AAD5S5S5_9FUNG|nr:hypothetical protein HK097_002114 [Rhizophlyctis rosea]
MCYTVEFVLWDILVVLAVVLLILWILSLTHIIFVNLGPLLHIFLVVGILFLLVWLFIRCCRRGGRTRSRHVV